MSNAVSGVGSTQSTTDQSTTAATSKGLGKDAFLTLLVTQLKNQDPMNPMDNTQFVAQMAQFSSLEQMQNMNTNLQSFTNGQSIYGAASMVGKTVKAVDLDTGDPISGKVDRVLIQSGKLILGIGDKEIPIDSVQELSQ